jgi:hypothetical protein
LPSEIHGGQHDKILGFEAFRAEPPGERQGLRDLLAGIGRIAEIEIALECRLPGYHFGALVADFHCSRDGSVGQFQDTRTSPETDA